MTEINKLEILKHIKLGTSEVLYYPYNDGREPLPLRPLSSFELDQCFYKALENANQKVSDLVIKIKLKLIDRDRDVNVSDEGYANLLKFYDYVDYWIVFYAMKDFQDEEFVKPNFDNNFPNGFDAIINMLEVHEIANFVLDTSRDSPEIIKEIILDDYGKEIAYVVYYLNSPLALAKDLTKLQRDYLIYSKGEVTKVKASDVKTKQYEFSGKKMTIGDLLKKIGMVIPKNG